MKKTYKLVTHKKPLSENEIEKKYDGYWVYVVKAKLSETGSIIEGYPVVVGLVPYDGVEDGIYDKYKTDKYAERVGISLCHNTGFISSLRILGEANA
ncbi:MAG: hypothetical protein LBC73_00830 [Oscillospiraceae bacterium]|jgi:hypothetical protein|nr:hypothetical protein [Oscillospiraceae bacterium]